MKILFVLLSIIYVINLSAKEKEVESVDIEFSFSTPSRCLIGREDLIRFLTAYGTWQLQESSCENAVLKTVIRMAPYNTLIENVFMPSKSSGYHQDVYMEIDTFFSFVALRITDGKNKMKKYSQCLFTKNVDDNNVCYMTWLYIGTKKWR